MDSDISTPEKKREYNASLFSVVAPRYDFVTRALSFGRDKSWKRYILAGLPEDEPGFILDIATGTGDFIKGFKTRFPDSDILGIDLNLDMLLYSSKRLSGELVSFSRQDMCDIGIRSGSAGLVSAGYALRNAPDLRKALSEIYRVLKPGGCAVFLDFSKPANRVFQGVEQALLSFWGGLWGLILHRNPGIYAYISKSLKTYPDRDSLHCMMKEAGFRDMRFKRFFFGVIEVGVCVR